VGNISSALVARDGEKVSDPEREAETHERAVRAHIDAAALDGQPAIHRHRAQAPHAAILILDRY
jgi:hypothetical protein